MIGIVFIFCYSKTFFLHFLNCTMFELNNLKLFRESYFFSATFNQFDIKSVI